MNGLEDAWFTTKYACPECWMGVLCKDEIHKCSKCGEEYTRDYLDGWRDAKKAVERLTR